MATGLERGLMECYRDWALVFELSSDEELLIDFESDLLLADDVGSLIVVNNKKALNLLQELLFFEYKIALCHLVLASGVFKQTGKLL